MGCVFSSHYSPFFYILPKEYNPALKNKNKEPKIVNEAGQEEQKVYSWFVFFTNDLLSRSSKLNKKQFV
jgi:hypothetical protein